MEKPRIAYYPDSDTLVLDKNEPRYEGETIAPQLWVAYNRNNDAVVSVTIDSAATLLKPYLFPADGQKPQRGGVSRGYLQIRYTPENDTLELQTGQPPYVRKIVMPGICVNYDPDGWAMAVTIEPAADLLRPHLFPGAGIKDAAPAAGSPAA